jgi:hypothetical protein
LYRQVEGVWEVVARRTVVLDASHRLDKNLRANQRDNLV